MGIFRIKRKLIQTLSKLGRFEAWKRLSLKLMVRYVAPERPRRFPARIQIEATSKCNLCCPSCSHSREKGAGRHLTQEGLRRVLDRLPWSPRRVVLSGIGEPLTNPEFFSLVDILAERGIKCEFYTNGTLLTPQAQQAILSRRNIDTVAISCDGAEKATFESLRLGADFESWKQLAREFLAEAKQQRPGTLSIWMNVVVSRENLSEMEDIVRLAAELGFEGASLMHPIPVDERAAALCPSLAEPSIERQEDVSALGRSLGLKLLCSFRRAKTPPEALPRCTQPWEYVFIRTNGDVAPCCALFGSEKGAVMGNILEQEFVDIWQGERFRAFRRTNALGGNTQCRICPYH
jgi:radical SAM protein with 4Fe4S-binding SPASM domain